MDDVVIDRDAAPADAYFDTSGDGVPDSDFAVGRGAILVDTSNPGRGTACGLVTDVNAAGNSVRVEFENFITATGATLVLVPAVGYSIQPDVNGVPTLLRNGIALASDVEDLQIAYFIDSDENGQVTTASEYPGSDLSPIDYAAKDTDHSKLREIRFNIVVRSRNTDPSYSEGFVQATENRGVVGCQRRLPPSRLHVDGPSAEHRLPRRRGKRMRSHVMRRRESGSALIITVLVMLLLGAIGISALDTVMRDQQVAGYQNRSSTAFYAAEAGVAQAKDLVRRNVLSGTERARDFADYATPSRSATRRCLSERAADLLRRPRSRAKSRSQSLDESLKIAGAAGSDMRQRHGPALNNFALWKIRVAGQTADGARLAHRGGHAQPDPGWLLGRRLAGRRHSGGVQEMKMTTIRTRRSSPQPRWLPPC